MVNSDFDSSEQNDYPSLEDASRNAIRSAVRVAADVIAGEAVTTVEVRVSERDKLLARHVVTLSVAHLAPDA